jgi:hypothetical protein
VLFAASLLCTQPVIAGITGTPGTEPTNSGDARYQAGAEVIGMGVNAIAGALAGPVERHAIEQQAKESLKDSAPGSVAAIERQTDHVDTSTTRDSVLSGQTTHTGFVGVGKDAAGATTALVERQRQPRLEPAGTTTDQTRVVYAQKLPNGGIDILDLSNEQKGELIQQAQKEIESKRAAQAAAAAQPAQAAPAA